VYEYSSGNFDSAKRHVAQAIKIMKDLVPANHLMLASAKRVKALILEEQALESSATPLQRGNNTKFSDLKLTNECLDWQINC
jgi:hypothetical protein